MGDARTKAREIIEKNGDQRLRRSKKRPGQPFEFRGEYFPGRHTHRECDEPVHGREPAFGA